MQALQRRQLLVSKGWIQAVVLVVLCGFFILGLLAYRTEPDLARLGEAVERAEAGEP